MIEKFIIGQNNFLNAKDFLGFSSHNKKNIDI